jgi:putative type-I specificity determinant subunit
MTKENGKPQIRFAKFKDTWEQRKLSEVAEFNPKSELPETFEYVDLESVVGTEMVSHRTETRETAPSRAQRLARTGDVFFQTVRPYQRNNYLFEKPDNNYVFSTGYAQMRPKIDAEFLMCFLQTDSFVKVVLDNCTGTSYPAINSNDLSNLEIVLPASDDEQRRIGSFISNLDNLITLHQRKYDKLTKAKKSMLEKMFPKNGTNVPEIRFKGFTDAWEQRKLGEMMEVTSVKRIHQSDWTDSGVRFLRARDIVAESKKENVSEPLFISQEKYDEYSAVSGKVKKGDLLVTGVGTIGVPMLINSEEPLYFKDGNIIWFKNENVIDGRFFYYSFNGLNIQKFIKESAGLGTVGTYTIENGKKTPINLPPKKDEQAKIGEYFFNLDHLITLHQRKLEKLKILKKACLEKMFV